MFAFDIPLALSNAEHSKQGRDICCDIRLYEIIRISFYLYIFFPHIFFYKNQKYIFLKYIYDKPIYVISIIIAEKPI